MRRRAHLAPDPYDLLPPVPPGTPNHREAALFRRHPLRHVYTSRSGKLLPVEFPFFSLDSRFVICTAKYVHELLKLLPSECHPIINSDGRALVALYLNEYKDTSAGPYKNMTLMAMTAREHTVIRCKDEYSS